MFQKTQTEPHASCIIEFGENNCDPDWDAVSEDPSHFHDGKVPIDQFKEELAYFIEMVRRKELEPI